jgi:hypothetical protein
MGFINDVMQVVPKEDCHSREDAESMLASLVATRSAPLCAKSDGFWAFAPNDGKIVRCVTLVTSVHYLKDRARILSYQFTPFLKNMNNTWFEDAAVALNWKVVF